MTKLRTDIQALRGIAVLLVVLYHFDVGPFKTGYLGVDIFFVVSGFLITTLIAKGIRRGNFSFRDFYYRRAKRLLPAAYTTILFVVVPAPWLLTQAEMHDLSAQVIGAVTFTANFVLWQQTDYFAGTSDRKPLLHMWSLAIEEQYYLVLPAVLTAIPQRFWTRFTAMALLLSFGACMAGLMTKPVATFYLLPTRAWELLTGSMGALWALERDGTTGSAVTRFATRLFYPSLATLVLVPMLPLPGRHPGLSAAVVCLATIVLILRAHPAAHQNLLARALAAVGDVSYSIYLVHWPLLALLRNAWAGPEAELPMLVKLATLALSFSVSYLIYRWVENPIRQMRPRSAASLIGKLALASLALVSITPMELSAGSSSIDHQQLLRPNYGLSQACEYKGLYTPLAECQTTPQPQVMVWGDSYAMHLLPGLARDPAVKGLIQATQSNCGPLLGIEPSRLLGRDHNPVDDRLAVGHCIAFNNSVLKYLQSAEQVNLVILSSALIQYVDKTKYVHIVATDQGLVERPADVPRALAGLLRTVEALRSMNKKVLLVAPPPAGNFDVGSCLDRMLTGRLSFGASSQCAIPRPEYLTRMAKVRELLALARQSGVQMLEFEPYLCNVAECVTFLDDTIIYRDSGHLSFDGSVFLARRMGWADVLEQVRQRDSKN